MLSLFRPSQRRTIAAVILGLFVLVSLAAGCQSIIPPLQPTDTPIPTRTRRPATFTQTTSASPTPTATLTPTPDTRIQTAFAPDVNPLTGEKVADPNVLNRRPLAIKVSNYPPEVRPQRGLSQADLVFEHILEGVTRLTAVFYGQTPELVGSVRSARYLDLEIPVMYKSFFAYSGSSGGIKQRIQSAPWFNRVMSPDFGVPESGDPFARIPQGEKAFEHTLFAKPALLYKWAQNHGMDNSRQDLKGLAFSDTPIGSSQPASSVVISYTWRSPHPAEVVRWRYDATTGRYQRFADGIAWTDANNSQPISAANVIVVYANHVTDCTIQENPIGVDPDCKTLGQFSIQVQIWGQGPVQVFRDGKVLNGRWVRANPEDMLAFVGADGKPLPLKRGNSWLQMLPTDTQIQIEP
jgi:Protein of unknown function (DUF3048) N-terminal domain/Protein of unknown function (DUF3048) C-terminal domain